MYAKVFKSLFYGSMTGKPDLQLVFLCLLPHCNADGYVELPPHIIAGLTGLPLERVTAALATLEGPDPESRTETDEGRRLERVGPAGRWNIVNYTKYRAIRDEEQRRQQNRESQARYRAKHRKPRVSQRKPQSAQAEVEVDGEAESEAEETPPNPLPPREGDADAPPQPPSRARRVLRFESRRRRSSTRKARRRSSRKKATLESEPSHFAVWWRTYPLRKARPFALKEYVAALEKGAKPLELLYGAQCYACEVSGREPEMIMMPANWLRGERWKDELDERDELEGIQPSCPTCGSKVRVVKIEGERAWFCCKPEHDRWDAERRQREPVEASTPGDDGMAS